MRDWRRDRKRGNGRTVDLSNDVDVRLLIPLAQEAPTQGLGLLFVGVGQSDWVTYRVPGNETGARLTEVLTELLERMPSLLLLGVELRPKVGARLVAATGTVWLETAIAEDRSEASFAGGEQAESWLKKTQTLFGLPEAGRSDKARRDGLEGKIESILGSLGVDVVYEADVGLPRGGFGGATPEVGRAKIAVQGRWIDMTASRYVLGRGSDSHGEYLGIWDRTAPAAPLVRYKLSQRRKAERGLMRLLAHGGDASP